MRSRPERSMTASGFARSGGTSGSSTRAFRRRDDGNDYAPRGAVGGTNALERRGGGNPPRDRRPARSARRTVQAGGVPAGQPFDRVARGGAGCGLAARRTALDPGSGGGDRGEDTRVPRFREDRILRASQEGGSRRAHRPDAPARAWAENRSALLGRARDRRSGRAPSVDRGRTPPGREGVRRPEDRTDPDSARGRHAGRRGFSTADRERVPHGATDRRDPSVPLSRPGGRDRRQLPPGTRDRGRPRYP